MLICGWIIQSFIFSVLGTIESDSFALQKILFKLYKLFGYGPPAEEYHARDEDVLEFW